MSSTIRPMRAAEHEEVVELAVRIWAPVFASVNGALGPELARLLHGEDWREHQRLDTRRILESDSPDSMAWVGERQGRLLGFCAAAVVDPDRSIGEVRIVGVVPEEQRTGCATQLVDTATSWLAERGMKVAYISTGGDAGHAPARHLYERLGFTLFPSAQYFRTL